MGKISRLPSDLATQIAAGEVVERPASVVKELVENALDAGARRITVAVELGGKRLIRVEDDGEGMSPEDAQLAVERHATSKISRPEDLGTIRTLGFRGEALPSIASVAHFVLRTRARGTPGGTEVRVSGGTVSSVREVGTREGTFVEVSNLFYNLPARRKFLKSDAAETAQISRLVTQMALAHPEVGFSLTSATRQVLQCPPTAGLPDRFYQLFGDRSDLVDVHRETAGIRLFGLVAALGDKGPVRGPQNLFVNRRIVKDRTIAHAVAQAYSSATIKERSPEVHLFLELPPSRVDVNVHPTKAEVRFLEQGLVHDVIWRALGDALGQAPLPELRLRAAGVMTSEPTARTVPGVMGGAGTTSRWAPLTAVFGRQVPGTGEAIGAETPTPRGSQDAVGTDLTPPPVDVRPMLPLGQFRNTFIIAVDEDGLSVVDQHVAHERVLFEQLMERLTSERLESQRLLQPVILQLSLSQRQAVVAHKVDLERLGIEVEEFGGDAVRLVAVPAILDRVDVEATVRALAEDLEGLDRGGRGEDALRRIAATMACHAAVKANDPLTMEKMAYILDELRRTAYSSVCPHGRPVALRLTRREIEKNFQRI